MALTKLVSAYSQIRPWFIASIVAISSSFAGAADLQSGTITSLDAPAVSNVLWYDDNFSAPAYLVASNCSLVRTTNFPVPGNVVTMKKGVTWSAADCGTPMEFTGIPDAATITNFLFSSTNAFQGTLKRDGCWARFYFERDTSYSLLVSNARVYTAEGDVYADITFNGDNSTVLNLGGPTVTNSDWVPMWQISKGSNYMVRYDYQTGPCEDPTIEMFLVEMPDSYGTLNYFANTGTPYAPTFTSVVANWRFMGTEASPPCFVDMDKDGDHDMLLFTQSALKLYWNTGPRDTFNTWTLCTTNVVGCTCSRNKYTVADIDADGDLDVAYGHGASGGRLWLIRNVGTATSPAWSSSTLADNVQNPITLLGDYVAPEFFDADGDGDLDMFSGSAAGGNLYFWRNTGTPASPVFFRVTDSYLTTNIPDMACTVPRFADLNSDGLKDLIIGGGSSTDVKPDNGKVLWYPNIGSSTNPVWDTPVLLATGAGYVGVPTFVDIEGPAGADGSGPAVRWGGSVNHSSINGTPVPKVIGLNSVEVGYPSTAHFRSGVFDSHCESLTYDAVNWTEKAGDGNDIQLRVRTGSEPDLSDATEADWQPLLAPHFDVCDATNSLAEIPRKRYVQYESFLMCGVAGADYAHTNITPPMLRAVTIYGTPVTFLHGIPYEWMQAHDLTRDPAAMLDGDPDDDGLLTWQEYIADTDPTNALSKLALASMSAASNDSQIITWAASSSRVYDLYRSTNTQAETFLQDWTLLDSNLQSSAGTVSHTNHATTDRAAYFRVRARLP